MTTTLSLGFYRGASGVLYGAIASNDGLFPMVLIATLNELFLSPFIQTLPGYIAGQLSGDKEYRFWRPFFLNLGVHAILGSAMIGAFVAEDNIDTGIGLAIPITILEAAISTVLLEGYAMPHPTGAQTYAHPPTAPFARKQVVPPAPSAFSVRFSF